MTLDILFFIGGLVVAAIVVNFLMKRNKVADFNEAQKKAELLLGRTKEEAEKYLESMKNRIDEIKKSAQEENIRLKNQLDKLEQILKNKEVNILKKEERLNSAKNYLNQEENTIKLIKEKAVGLRTQVEEKLINISKVDKDVLKRELIDNYKNEVNLIYLQKAKKIENHAEENSERIAKNIVRLAIQKFDDPTSVEKNVTTVKLARDESKGRIVGKDGKNIIFFEELLQVDVIFNDAPNLISIGGHDLVRRSIAKIALGKLAFDRVINEDTIRKRIDEGKKEISSSFLKAGQKVIKLLDLKNVSEDLVKIIGRLQYRTSYGQNILKHSLEVSYFSALLGSELGADIEICKVAGFFHDIGKAIDQEVEGSHDLLSKQIMQKFNYSDAVVHAVYAHHEAEPCRTLEATIVKAADAISAGRPGARQESLDKYIERLRALEDIGMAHSGVKKTFAISAGREIRVLVEPDTVQDKDMLPLAKGIAEKIEKKLSYPGKIKVNIIRKTQATDYAK